MKRNILLWLCLYASLCQAQEVSLRVADSWVPLKMEEMQTEIKPGWSIAGKKLKDTRVLYLWGKSSRQVTDDRKPVLKVEPGERETLVDYALVQLKRRRDHRRLAKSELPQFTVKADGKQAFVCQPAESLAPGEYVLVWLCQTLKDEQAGYRVFPFSIP